MTDPSAASDNQRARPGLNVLIIGSGGREHAIAWKIAQSPELGNLYIAPGNAGTAGLGENIPIRIDNCSALVAFSNEKHIDLVMIGPEIPLILGLADALQAASIPVFGPSRAAAQIEGSKAFSKAFMVRHAIPTARFETFSNFDNALVYLRKVETPIVLKASGLAAGKGVVLPEDLDQAQQALREMMVDGIFSEAGRTVVIEERLEGEEVSLLVFCDGKTIQPMPPAQDHKRLLDGDRGPNTGGMGAYAPAPVLTPELTAQVLKTIVQPAVDGLRAEGMPFVGVLYTGLMLTASGPMALEFNCRFGDPETQAILPLLDSDLLEILTACASGSLHSIAIRWKPGACASVVAASQNYPQSGASDLRVSGLDHSSPNTIVFHAGTCLQSGQILASGGRILDVTAWGSDLAEAVSRAYTAIRQVSFTGMRYRTDIGARALHEINPLAGYTYAESGVNIDAGNRAVQLMASAVRSTYTPSVLAGIGAFGGLFDATQVQAMRHPVLVASTDGVGTKVKLAAQVGRYRSIGQDIVNHCINDILVQGARPLFFLDYFATSCLDPEITAEIVAGISVACQAAGCVLLGGETAEMPGVYVSGEFDLAGTIVGQVEYDRILPRAGIQPGDLLVGLASSGPHTNGFSLIRQVLKDISLDTVYPELGRPLADALLEPHRSYLGLLQKALDLSPSPIKALAHLTGGGFFENIPRILPEGLGVTLQRGSWPVPPLFLLIQSIGQINDDEMARVFNLGIGMVALVDPGNLPAFLDTLSEPAWVIGVVTPGEKRVTFQ